MSTVTAPIVPALPSPPPSSPTPAAGGDSPARTFLTGYAATLLLPLLVPIAALELGWLRFTETSWPAAVAATVAWAMAVGAWMRRRGWPGRAALTVLGAPAAALAVPAALGELSPSGFLLWALVSTALAAALAMAAQPLAPTARPPIQRAAAGMSRGRSPSRRVARQGSLMWPRAVSQGASRGMPAGVRPPLARWATSTSPAAAVSFGPRSSRRTYVRSGDTGSLPGAVRYLPPRKCCSETSPRCSHVRPREVRQGRDGCRAGG
jgi:hypothetical protein